MIWYTHFSEKTHFNNLRWHYHCFFSKMIVWSKCYLSSCCPLLNKNATRGQRVSKDHKLSLRKKGNLVLQVKIQSVLSFFCMPFKRISGSTGQDELLLSEDNTVLFCIVSIRLSKIEKCFWCSYYKHKGATDWNKIRDKK